MASVERRPDPKIYPHVAEGALPASVRHGDLVQSIPIELFEISEVKAFAQVLGTLAFTAVGLYITSIVPWYLLPLAWIFTGTAFTGWFVIGHDCGHNSFSKYAIVNDVVGVSMFLPLFYPFEPWRIQHNWHHNNTNKLYVDNAWQPFQAQYYDQQATTLERAVMHSIRAWPSPMYPISSIGHWIQYHFDFNLFKPCQQRKVNISLAAIAIGAAVFFPVVLMTVGVWGLVKFWLMPWLIFHFWLSTFTLVHHTLPHIPFKPEADWRNAEARLSGTVHCEYPFWVEWLTWHINVHVPHHVSTRIPSYNLRRAHQALKSQWGKYINEAVFGVPLLKDILANCQLYHEEENYQTFAKDTRPQPKPQPAEISKESSKEVSSAQETTTEATSTTTKRTKSQGKGSRDTGAQPR